MHPGYVLALFLYSVCLINAAGGRKSNGARAKVHLIANATNVAAPTTTTPPRTPPPPPPPPKSCAEDGKCTEANKKCNAELKCVCDVKYREISDGSCVEKPQFGDRCFDNITWLECFGPGVDTTCFSAEGPNHGRCICAKGHEPSKSEKSCSPIIKHLGEACSQDAECVLSYSSCSAGKCACINGFSAGSDGTCQPKEHRCPSGEPKKEKGQVVPCEVDFDEKTGQITDNCGANNFCFVPPHSLTSAGKPRGHCCPTPSPPDSAKLVCPYGDPLSNATCPDKKSGSKEKSTCPADSHQCFAVQFKPNQMICCPDPCRQSISHFDYNGRCYDYVMLGNTCELQAQCTGDAECVDNGGQKVCRCKKGFNQASANQCEEP